MTFFSTYDSRVLALAQVLSEWGAFGADEAGVLSYCPI